MENRSRFLIITARFQSHQTRIVSFSIAKILNSHTSKNTHTQRIKMTLVNYNVFHGLNEKAHAQKPDLHWWGQNYSDI